MNTYHAFYAGKKIELEAPTSYDAQKQAAQQMKAKKSHQVTVVLVAKGDTPVLVDPAQL